MKRILITGADSYIGTSFEKYIKENYSDDYTVDTVDMLDGKWRDKDFSVYDCVFHVAGIVCSGKARKNKEKHDLYYAVNTDLPIATAFKAKTEGVGQFIFMSSAAVYGDSAPIGKKKIIGKDTPVSPANCYGDSKLQAENGILALDDENFKVVILRPPMIYGKGCKGNYPRLSKIARKTPFFPCVNNQKSMLYIENFCEFLRLMISNRERGIFCPQNSEYSNTAELVCMIADTQGKKVYLFKGLTWLLKIMSVFTKLINKAFGNFVYEVSLSRYSENYCIYGLKDSIRRTESQR